MRTISGCKSALVVAAVLTTGAMAQVGGSVSDEYRVKAAFVYNFAKFVEWPNNTFQTPQEPIVICILGQNPFGGVLEEVVSGKIVGSRTFVVHRITDLGPGCNCQILFIAASERKRFRSMLGKFQPLGVLTVGEGPGFAGEGGVINFKLEGGKVRFEINPDAAEQGQIHISSKLLSLAQIVKK